MLTMRHLKKKIPVYAHIKNFLTSQPAKFWVIEESLKLKHQECDDPLPG